MNFSVTTLLITSKFCSVETLQHQLCSYFLEICGPYHRGLQYFRDELLNKQSCIGLLTLGWEPGQYKQTVSETSDLIQELQTKNIDIKIPWTPGHTDIPGNKTVNRFAKEASLEANSLDLEVSTHSVH